MATINIPDSMVPEGYELTGEYRCPKEGEYINAADPDTGKPFAELAEFNYKCCLYAILRRKPVLIRVVLDVTGPKRRIKRGEYFLLDNGRVDYWYAHENSDREYIPLSAPVQVTK